MAATGKKSKKSKWIKANITDILAEPTTIPTTNSWAETGEDGETESFGFATRPRAPVVLPSASRAARGGMAVDDESIPQKPPFIAHISNLPYDVDESAIADLFAGLKIISLRLPRESDRLKGYGYIDFEDRESLINAMNLPDLTISGRRIRICVSTQETDRRMGRSGRQGDRERDYDPERTMGDWRSGPRVAPETTSRPRPERDLGPMTRDNMREPMTRDNMREPMTRDNMREPMTRDNMRERERDSSADNRPGGWRDGERPAPEPARAPYAGRDSFGRDRFGEDRGRERSGFGGRDGFRAADREGGGGFGSREGRSFGSRGFGDRDRDPPREDAKPRERPKLNLLPRTVPREPEVATKPADGAPTDDPAPAASAPKPVPAEKVFGAAKPVDTAAKEREIEERLLKQGEESRRAADEKDRWGRRNDHSGDRRGGARRDDRGRDSRSYNRDRRDYSKDDKDRRDDRGRDYSKDDRDRRDYSKDDKDRRDYSKDDKDRRDSKDHPDRRAYSKDDKDRRAYSKDDGDRRAYSKDDKDRRDYSKDDKDRRDYSKDDKDRRGYSKDDTRRDDRDRRDFKDDRDRREHRDDNDDRVKRDYSGERRDSRDGRRDSRDDRRDSKDRDVRRNGSAEKDEERDQKSRDERNGRPRPSRSRDRHDDTDDKPLPKLIEQEKPVFVASNKFSFLEDAGDVSD